MTDIKKIKEKPYAPLAIHSRKLAAEGCVLLKNENNVLPIKPENNVSFFGRTQIDYIKSGTGSGGLVHTEYVVNIIDGVLNNTKINVNTELVDIYKSWIKENPFDEGNGWASEPWFQKEYVPDESVVKEAREKSDVAIIVIGRTAGEDRDNAPEKGSWYLTDKEEQLLDVVSKYFENTVVLLNVGNIIDMNWVEKYSIKAVIYVWQGGQEGGNAIADVLSGEVNPSGRLSDTIAKDISDYPSSKNFGNKDFNLYQEDIYVGYRYFETFAPDKVLYPFGFGLSYTDFEIEPYSVAKHNEKISAVVIVKNTGNVSGREVVQVYVEAPQGKLGKAKRSLCAFAKTGIIAPDKSDGLLIEMDIADFASYDDSGITGHKSCYVLEAGEYSIYVGKNVRDAKRAFAFKIDELTVTEQLTEALAPERDFDVLYPTYDFKPAYRSVSTRTVDYDKRIVDNLPKTIEYTGDKDIKLIDVKNGKTTMEEFIVQLSDTDLRCLVTGEGMSSPKARPGNAGVFGGITKELTSFGIPVICVHDGPSGIRMDNGDTATSMPNGTLIACSWDIEAAEKLYEYASVELCSHNIDSLLGPGINIHRSPLNGRNFEYLSEDPHLTGKIGAALVKGMSIHGNSATVKHFAANSQELCRNTVVSVVSERALREIYLKPFEMCVKEGNVKTIMTSYNPINEHWTAVNYELNTVILREEWGYTGMVMTDWWPKLSKEESDKQNLSDMIIAQNDVYMPAQDAVTFNSNIDESLENGTLICGQLQRNAKNILNYIMGTHTFERFIENSGKLETSLKDKLDELESVFEYKKPKNGQAIAIDYKNAGKHLLCIEYTANAPSISQLVIAVKINNKINISVTVRGTNRKKEKTYVDFTVHNTTGSIVMSFPQLVNIEKIAVMK
ncbi:beta-glucosidase [Lachnospiraceae bacterium MD329]|nr:beta-glucosidase [Lachnospiraceae bacterium MD329]